MWVGGTGAVRSVPMHTRGQSNRVDKRKAPPVRAGPKEGFVHQRLTRPDYQPRRESG